MCYFLLFTFLICGHNNLSRIPFQIHRPAFMFRKITRSNLTTIDQGQRKPIRQNGTKLFHQIQRQRRPTRAHSV